MELATFGHSRTDGWQPHALPDLDSDRTLVVVFGHSSYVDDPTAIRELKQRYPRAHVVGCSTAGEILNQSLVDDSLAVAVARFDQVTLASASAPVNSPDDSRSAGHALGAELNRPGLRAVIVLSDGLNVNGSELVRGLSASLPADVSLTGGLAGDGDRFARTWVLHDGVPRPGFVSAVGLYGPSLRVGHGSQGGWDLFGPERRVTRAKGNILYELDGKPALQLYKQYLGELAAGLPATGLLFPLAVRGSADDENLLVRTILAVDEDAQSMIFAGDLPNGGFARLMRANLDRLIDGASDAASMSAATPADGPTLSLAISCVGRRLVLGERTEEEIEAVLDTLPDGTGQIGFYSYGEISPSNHGDCDLHNQTMTLTTLGEVLAG